ncbi:MAG: thioredoxin domain-containing protein [Thaumarchaeota archaeon]|nr:thioredoxin domain-containing protein [Nitrososphaerota archaeon]MDE1876924.1 thioredoxin domain-containing protein [Nitrososphaerota archaeon]
MPNNLIKESSPYLLQHANNPVQWHAWGEEALDKAKQENKPIFLSIGYSACHWCHVMAHESFENEEIAKAMNENFINIKVDREERPDIDDIYQKVCQMTTGSGGWPLSVFLTPDQRPFYVGTYFPPLDNYGRPGFGSIVLQLAQAWKEKPGNVEQAAENFINTLQKTESISLDSKLERSILDEAAMNLLSIADTTNGGFGQAPKFPNASNISFVLRYSKLSGIAKFQEFAFKTLTKMANGGMYDQLGGGFHRYSTDARWLVPHFEKMLYDNALLPPVYAEAYQISKDPRYLEVINGTLRYVLGHMTSPQGGFYSAEDADSEGEEGKFYVWKKKEIQEILGKDADIFCLYYDVTDGGNFEGHTILYNNMNLSSIAFHFGKSESEIKQILKQSREKLYAVRVQRVPPGRDDKIMTNWNSLMITAFIKGYRVTGEWDFFQAATNCIEFIESQLTRDGELLHTYKNGHSKLRAYLDDYAYFVNALLDYFEIAPSKKHLDLAVYYANYLIEHFWDENQKSFFFTADNHEKLIIRTKNIYDLSLPSGNSVTAWVMLRLYHLTQEKKYLDISIKVMESLAVMAAENPFGFGQLLNTMYAYLQKPVEITLINTINHNIKNYLLKKFIPEAILVMISKKEDLENLKDLQFFTGKEFEDAKTKVYVCRDFTCSLPLETVSEIEKLV